MNKVYLVTGYNWNRQINATCLVGAESEFRALMIANKELSDHSALVSQKRMAGLESPEEGIIYIKKENL